MNCTRQGFVKLRIAQARKPRKTRRYGITVSFQRTSAFAAHTGCSRTAALPSRGPCTSRRIGYAVGPTKPVTLVRSSGSKKNSNRPHLGHTCPRIGQVSSR